MENKPIVGMISEPKPRVRTRTHLTSFQINKDQKETIDQAFNLFQSQNEQFVNKGQFIEGLCMDYIRRHSNDFMGGEMPQEQGLPQ